MKPVTIYFAAMHPLALPLCFLTLTNTPLQENIHGTWGELPTFPDTLGVAGPFAGVSTGALVVAGGANFPHGYPWDGGKKEHHDTIYFLDKPTGKWSQAQAKLPHPMGYGVSISLPQRGSVLCLGGNDSSGAAVDDVFEIQFENGSISIRQTLPKLPFPSTMGCGALLGETVYYFSGENQGTTHQKAFRLNLAKSPPTWETLPWPKNAPGRILAVAGAAEGKLYMFSGCDLGSPAWDKRTYLKDAWRFSPETNAWEALADLPESAAAAPNLAVNTPGKLLLFGGSNRPFVEKQRTARPATNGNGLEHPGFPKQILAYDLRLNSWTTCGEIPGLAPVTTTAVAWQDSIIFPSGEVKPGIRSPQMRRFTLKK